MPAQGMKRYRKHQFGRQSSMGTAVAAKKAYPFQGVPTPDLAWTQREIDEGSLDPVAKPIRGAPNLTTSLTDPAVEYNVMPLYLSGFFGDDVDSTGAGDDQTWAYEPASLTVDTIDVFTYEFGDDVQTDWFQYADSIIESFEWTGANGHGVVTGSMSLRHGAMFSSGSTDSPDSPSVPTGSLSLEKNAAIWYMKDTKFFIASDPDDLATSQIMAAVEGMSLKFSGDVDQKRYAEGDQSFDIDDYARATRMIEIGLTLAKTSDTVGEGSESDAWMSDESVDRYIQITATSKTLISTGPDVPYSLDMVMPMRYFTREDQDEGGNDQIVLTGHAFYDDENEVPVFSGTVVNTLDSSSDF